MGSNTSGLSDCSACVLDRDLASASEVASHLQTTGFITEKPLLFQNKSDLLAQLTAASADVIVVDLEALGGEDVLGEIPLVCPEAILLAMSSQGSLSRAISSMSAGAHDFLARPFTEETLKQKLAALLPARRRKPAPSRHATKAQPKAKPAAKRGQVEPFLGSCPAMQGVYDQISKMAGSAAPVFITGEAGTGKELCAQTLHDRSKRKPRPFTSINCAAIPDDLLDSELFGHGRGAFTGAEDVRKGAIELADNGTLFLDEIGELDLKLQGKLLRFMQKGTFQRVGETVQREADVRIVCASNRNPLVEVQAGRLREDLFYRLHVLPIHLPPLRDRHGDVIELAETFLQRFSTSENKRFKGFSPAAERVLRDYTWPGNVRELENTIRQITILHDGLAVTPDMLPSSLQPGTCGLSLGNDNHEQGYTLSERFSSVEPLWTQEKRIIENALAVFEGNIAQAAAALEISPSTIYRKKQSWAERQAC
ncbi:sigma-54-dependent transcriptional regulator [Pseudovibrio exalbescens]|uniref:sigma-54-dependent transcriptional regulator n=1 Tax=Pseudovibrio exalbescens TaxID=197461 RepID=UPI0015E0F7F7|nr:sigma-54 dependent transcriptional regulator [Pseudovibrio exalbescens]